MTISRRDILKRLASAATLASAGGLPVLAQAARPERIIPWRNWSGAQSCIPAQRAAPGSVDELAQLIRASSGGIRPVGSGHSFSALVPTDGTILSLARLTGLVDHDADSLQAEFQAGTPMSEMGEPLKGIGQALPNMADIDYQTLAGALATSTHGTGVDYGSYSTQVVGLQLVDGQGQVLDCDAQNNPEMFNAARVSLGALGVLTRVRLQNRKAFRLKEKMWLAKTEELLEDIENLKRENQHWEMQVLTNSDYAASITLNETQDAATATGDEEDEGGNSWVRAIEKLDKYGSDFPRARHAIMNLIARTADFEERVADSFKIYANVRNIRFNEMEYSVPAEAGPDCLREILSTIHERNLPTWFPIEYRYVQADDIPLSMFEGRASCAISIHQYYQMDYHNFFAAVEPIFWKYEGRPHWGKLHTLNARHLAKLYPRWQDFQNARSALDPAGKFLNAHLRSVLGVPA